MRQGRAASGAPGPKLWCVALCGNWVDKIDAPGEKGAVLVKLGPEGFWFCELLCARNVLEEMCQAIYEGKGSLSIMLPHTISDN